MAICALLSHRDVYDVNLGKKLRRAAWKVVNTNDSVDFWICSTYKTQIMLLWLLAALGERNKHPDKVQITYIMRHGEESKLPFGMVNRVIYPEEGLDIKLHKDLMSWVVRRTTHLVRCVYYGLNDTNAKVPLVGCCDEIVELIDLMDPGISNTLKESISHLTEDERKVYDRMTPKWTALGMPKSEIVKELAVSPEMVNQLAWQCLLKLHKSLRKRYKTESAKKNYRDRPDKILEKCKYKTCKYLEIIKTEQ